jgi:outer membrane lipoprotein-sorting protein
VLFIWLTKFICVFIGGSASGMPDNSGNLNPLLQQLLMGQRSINSYTSSLAQQQSQHGMKIESNATLMTHYC